MMRGGGLFGADQQPGAMPTTPPPEKIDRPALQLKSSTTLQNSSEFQVTNDSFLTRDEKFASLTFQLASGELKLNVDSEKATLVTLQFKQLKSLMSFKFRSEAITSIIELGDLTVLDNYTTNTIYPKLVACSPRPGIENSPVFYLSHERFGQMQKFHCETAPLTMIHNAQLMRHAKGFFKKSSINTQDGLEDWRQRKAYQGLKEGAKRNLQSAWEGVISGRSSSIGSGVQITLDLSAPKIVIPKNITDKNSPQILIDFGRLKFANNRDEYRDDDEDEEAFYTPETGTPPSEPTGQESVESLILNLRFLFQTKSFQPL